MFHRQGIGFLGHPALRALLAGCLLRRAESARKIPSFRVFTLRGFRPVLYAGSLSSAA
jgi:hypothetical protein